MGAKKKSRSVPGGARGAWPDPNVETVVDHAVAEPKKKISKSLRYQVVIHMAMELSKDEWDTVKGFLDAKNFKSAKKHLKDALPKDKPHKKKINANRIIDAALNSLSP